MEIRGRVEKTQSDGVISTTIRIHLGPCGRQGPAGEEQVEVHLEGWHPDHWRQRVSGSQSAIHVEGKKCYRTRKEVSSMEIRGRVEKTQSDGVISGSQSAILAYTNHTRYVFHKGQGEFEW
jgi:hypothetical protein